MGGREETRVRIEGATKSGRSRTVSIDAETVQVLRDHRKRQAGERLRVGPEWRGADDYVFSTAWGEPIHPDTVSSLMTTLTNTHNDQQSEPLPHARLHDLRHVVVARRPGPSVVVRAPGRYSRVVHTCQLLSTVMAAVLAAVAVERIDPRPSAVRGKDRLRAARR